MVYPLINYRNAFAQFVKKLVLFKRIMNDNYVVVEGISPDTIDKHIRTCSIVIRKLNLLIEEKGLTDDEVRKKDPEAGTLKNKKDGYEQDKMPFNKKWHEVNDCVSILEKELSRFIEETSNNKEEES